MSRGDREKWFACSAKVESPKDCLPASDDVGQRQRGIEEGAAGMKNARRREELRRFDLRHRQEGAARRATERRAATAGTKTAATAREKSEIAVTERVARFVPDDGSGEKGCRTLMPFSRPALS